MHATVYVKADNAEAAHTKARELVNGSVEIVGDDRDLFCGLAFDNPCLPEMSLSPAITIGDLEGVESVESV
ncbi:hypothetical protein D3C80_2090060 [compost metagenome]